jgi:hypothetical protein
MEKIAERRALLTFPVSHAMWCLFDVTFNYLFQQIK